MSLLTKEHKKTHLASFDDNLSELLPSIRSNSEDFREREFWCGKWYEEIAHTETNWKKRSWFFFKDGNFKIVVEGVATMGRWHQSSSQFNRIDVSYVSGGMNVSECYDLGFIGKEKCVVLEKHGNPLRTTQHNEQSRYVCLLSSNHWRRNVHWSDYLGMLEKEGQQKNYFFTILIIAILCLIVGFLLTSI